MVDRLEACPTVGGTIGIVSLIDMKALASRFSPIAKVSRLRLRLASRRSCLVNGVVRVEGSKPHRGSKAKAISRVAGALNRDRGHGWGLSLGER